jgi:hypothetical protein
MRYVVGHEGACRALLVGAGDAVQGIVLREIAQQTAAIGDFAPGWLPGTLAVRFAVASMSAVVRWWLVEAPERSWEETATLLDLLVSLPPAAQPRNELGT